MKDTGFTVLVIAFWIAALFGYVANIYKLTKCDFDTPLKAEVIRVIGIVVPPMGAVIGYVEIEDAPKN